MALIDSHTIINTLLAAGAAVLALMLLRTLLRTTLRVFSVGCLALAGVAVVIGVVRWLA
jgi:hypothetical protein